MAWLRVEYKVGAGPHEKEPVGLACLFSYGECCHVSFFGRDGWGWLVTLCWRILSHNTLPRLMYHKFGYLLYTIEYRILRSRISILRQNLWIRCRQFYIREDHGPRTQTCARRTGKPLKSDWLSNPSRISWNLKVGVITCLFLIVWCTFSKIDNPPYYSIQRNSYTR